MPLLAGPILRRTDSKAVNVWIALDENIDVDLILKNETNDNVKGVGSAIKQVVGKKLVIVLVTFTPDIALSPGKIFSYDVVKKGTTTSLLTELLTSATPIGYSKNTFPSFILPASNIKDLIVAHGSCRKLHGDGPEALSIIDKQLEDNLKDPTKRIQQLFLTGDQIYADEIPRYALWAITKKAQEIISEKEDLPLPELHLTFNNETPAGSFDFPAKRINPTEAPPGLRAPIINSFAKMTTGEGGSHLMTFGEFCVAHLYAWSDKVWDDELIKAANDFTNIQGNWDSFKAKTTFNATTYTGKIIQGVRTQEITQVAGNVLLLIFKLL